MRKILICANPDLNLIDGSSIWTLVLTLALLKVGNTQVDLTARTSPSSMALYKEIIDLENVRVIGPEHYEDIFGITKRRLNWQEMAQIAKHYNGVTKYDAIFIRGKEIAFQLLDSEILSRSYVYLTDIEHDYNDMSHDDRTRLREISSTCHRVLCQSDGFVELWQKIDPYIDLDKLTLFPPVAPDVHHECLDLVHRPLEAVYAGKYTPEWMTYEMVKLWSRVRAQVPSAQLVMIGDKIHDAPDNHLFKSSMEDALSRTEGVHWLKGQPRSSVFSQLKSSRVGLSWRSAALDDIIEYSTKILEYGSYRTPAILNKNAIHVSLLGSDYPLFANSEEEFVSSAVKALTDPVASQVAADRLSQVAHEHSFSRRVKLLEAILTDDTRPHDQPAAKPIVRSTKSILIAGHDLKFVDDLAQGFGEKLKFSVRYDKWIGHNKHSSQKSLQFLSEADVIFCEWALGNSVWYSRNKKPHQKLFVRFHRQELETEHPFHINIDKIDMIIFVSRHTQEKAISKFNFPREKTCVIPNLVSESKFRSLKKFSTSRFTLGMVGIVPSMKRLDRAINVLENLLREDDRFVLRIKGHEPQSYSWLMKRSNEDSFYREIYDRINRSPSLRYRVIFDPAGNDVNEWLSLVGYILSPSDFESFHMAIGEGMLTGTVPIVWNWDGAGDIWPPQNIVASDEEATALISRLSQCNVGEAAFEYRDYVIERYGLDRIMRAWSDLLTGKAT